MRDKVIARVFEAWGVAPLQVARDNKLLDLYVESRADDPSLTEMREECREQRLAIRRSISALAASLEGIQSDWAVFKTSRPFPFTPSDVDTVVFDDGAARQIASRLPAHAYRPAGEAPHTVTVCDVRNDVGIDFYQDIAASWFVYLDTASLRPYLCRNQIDGVDVPVLSPVGELLTILAHATYKEQLFTLADYLTLRHCADAFVQADWEELLSLAEANGVRRAVVWCLRIARGVALVTDDPWELPTRVERAVGAPIAPCKMPYRMLSPWPLGLSVAERVATSARARSSLAELAAKSVNPTSKYSRALYRQLWLRAKGHTY